MPGKFQKFSAQMKLVILIVWLSRLAYAHNLPGNHIYHDLMVMIER